MWWLKINYMSHASTTFIQICHVCREKHCNGKNNTLVQYQMQKQELQHSLLCYWVPMVINSITSTGSVWPVDFHVAYSILLVLLLFRLSVIMEFYQALMISPLPSPSRNGWRVKSHLNFHLMPHQIRTFLFLLVTNILIKVCLISNKDKKELFKELKKLWYLLAVHVNLRCAKNYNKKRKYRTLLVSYK
jgi:hypothetical protein